MLVSLTPDKSISTFLGDQAYTPQYDPMWIISEGVYIPHIPFEFGIYDFEGGGIANEETSLLPVLEGKKSFGVCSNSDQVLQYYAEEVEHPSIKYFIAMTPLEALRLDAEELKKISQYSLGVNMSSLDFNDDLVSQIREGSFYCFNIYQL